MLDIAILTTAAGLLGISVLDLMGKFAEYKSKRRKLSNEIAVRDIQQASVLIANQGLLKQTVIQYYPAPVLKAAGLNQYSFSVNNVPVNTAIATKPEWTNLKTPLDEMHECPYLYRIDSPVTDFPEEHEEHILKLFSSIELMELQLWENPIYRLLKVDFSQGTVDASFAEDEFIRYRFSFGLLINELADALSNNEFSIDRVLRSADKLLPIRKSVLPDGASLINFPQRICAGGITMLFAIQRPEPYHDFGFPIQLRSDSVADGQGMCTIIPRAFHQPMVDVTEEVAPSFSAYSEIFEELYGGDEAVKDVRMVRHDWFFSDPAMVWFHDHPESFDLMCTCFGIDMVSGNYQFGMLLVIHDEGYWDEFGRRIAANWEGAKRGTRFKSSKDPASLAQLIQSQKWTGEGLFTLIEGLKRLAAISPQRVKLPPLQF